MSSKIKEELAKACGIKLTDVDADDLSIKLVSGISEVDDDTWDGLSPEAMTWYNEAADAINAKKPIPAFPDEVKEEPKASRRAAKPEVEEAKLEVGHVYTITTKRGKEVKGKVVELDDEVVVIERADGEEVEIATTAIDKFEIIGNKRSTKEVDEDEVATQADSDAPYSPKEGDSVVIVTKRGKEVKGKVVEIIDEDDLLVLEVDGEEVEVIMGTAQSISLDVPEVKSTKTERTASRVSKPAAEAKPEVEEAKPEVEEAKGKEVDKKPRVTSASNGGVSATQRMRELICENMDSAKTEISKMMTSEGITFRETTLDLVYADTTKVIAILKEMKLLK